MISKRNLHLSQEQELHALPGIQLINLTFTLRWKFVATKLAFDSHRFLTPHGDTAARILSQSKNSTVARQLAGADYPTALRCPPPKQTRSKQQQQQQ